MKSSIRMILFKKNTICKRVQLLINQPMSTIKDQCLTALHHFPSIVFRTHHRGRTHTLFATKNDKSSRFRILRTRHHHNDNLKSKKAKRFL